MIEPHTTKYRDVVHAISLSKQAMKFEESIFQELAL